MCLNLLPLSLAHRQAVCCRCTWSWRLECDEARCERYYSRCTLIRSVFSDPSTEIKVIVKDVVKPTKANTAQGRRYYSRQSRRMECFLHFGALFGDGENLSLFLFKRTKTTSFGKVLKITELFEKKPEARCNVCH